MRLISMADEKDEIPDIEYSSAQEANEQTGTEQALEGVDEVDYQRRKKGLVEKVGLSIGGAAHSASEFVKQKQAERAAKQALEPTKPQQRQAPQPQRPKMSIGSFLGGNRPPQPQQQYVRRPQQQYASPMPQNPLQPQALPGLFGSPLPQEGSFHMPSIMGSPPSGGSHPLAFNIFGSTPQQKGNRKQATHPLMTNIFGAKRPAKPMKRRRKR
jgi:hypothetical protein